MAKPPFIPQRYGVFSSAVENAHVKRLRLPYADGAVVTGVLKGLPADEAGLKVNDVVLAADGAPVVDPTSFNEILNRVPAGGSITLSELRAGERLEVVLTPAF
jgi:S1-C subfamily serine protease